MSDNPLFNKPEPAVNEAVAGEDVTPKRPRRSRLTSLDRRILAVMLAVAALLGVLSPGAPTGHTWIDGVYRAGFVVLMALAGSRARRWALVVGAAIGTIASVGLGLAFGFVALVMTVALILRDIRNRAYGACVGTFIAMACLRLDVGWFLGAESLVALAAAGPVLWSGYHVSSRHTRRVVRWTVGVAVAMAALGVVLAGAQAVAYIDDLNDAVAQTTNGISQTQGGKTQAAAQQFVQASKKFGTVADNAAAWYWFPTRLVPGLSQNLRTVPVVAGAGRSLTTAAATTTGKVDYSRLRREGGGIDLSLLDEFHDPVLDVSARLHQATADVDGARSPWLVPPLTHRLDQFDEKVSGLQRETDIAALAVTYGPALFGADGPRHYLILLGNPAEARDLGGHIGNMVELTVDNGVMSLDQVTVPRDLSQPELDNSLQESGLAPPSMLEMRPATFPQNWGTAIDFPTDAAVAARLYSAKVGHPIDGVAYADPFAMAGILSITGPISIPELGRPISSSDAVKFFTVDQYSAFPDQNVADEALTAFVRQMFDKLTHTTLPSPAQLGQVFGPLVRSGRFRFASMHADDHGLLGPLGLDLGFRPVAGDDLLAIITRDANPSKIDAFLHRSSKISVRWSPTDGRVRTTATVTLRNDAPSSGLPDYVIGNSAGEPSGTNVSDLAIVTPFEATRATVDGVDAPVTPLRDGDVWRHTVRVVIPPGKSVTVQLQLEGDVTPGRRYRLRFAGQPLVNPDDVAISVTSEEPSDEMVGGRGITVDGPRGTAKLTGDGRSDLTLKVR